jgi:hypothetical protein
MKIPFTGELFTSRSISANRQDLMNWYVEVDPSGQGKIILYPRPGLKLFANVGAGSIRGGISFNTTDSYIASSDKVYKLDAAGIATLVLTLTTSAGQVNFAHNGTDVLVIDGTSGYIITHSTGVSATIIDASFPASPTVCEFIDGYFLVDDPSATGKFVSSKFFPSTADLIDDSGADTGWSALDFDRASRSPDELTQIVVNYREIWLFGTDSIEIWVNAGLANFPFQALPNGFIEWGLVAKNSTAKADNSIFWLGKSNSGGIHVVRNNGFNPNIISTPAIDLLIQSMPTISDAIGGTYEINGHSFYVLNFPNANKTLQYNVTNKTWSQLSSKASLDRYRGELFLFHNNKRLVGDHTLGNIYEMDNDTHTDDGDVIKHIRTSQYINSDNKMLFHNALEIEIEGGVGTLTTPDPQMLVRWSDDGGFSWSNYQFMDMGGIGEYGVRLIKRKLGAARKRVYEISTSEDVKAVIINAYVDVHVSTTEV